jgi:hypothetical protein
MTGKTEDRRRKESLIEDVFKGYLNWEMTEYLYKASHLYRG